MLPFEEDAKMTVSTLIAIPDHFTIEWYLEQKDKRLTDTEISESLYISVMTLHKWKKEIGWKAGAGRKFCGRKRKVDVERIKRLHDEGLHKTEIAAALLVSVVTVSKWLKRLNAL